MVIPIPEEDGWPPGTPEGWRLAFALDEVARAYGWKPFARTTSEEEVSVVYVREKKSRRSRSE